ncbi:ATP12 family chaperone protein [Roseobacteraceae bacterium S113]
MSEWKAKRFWKAASVVDQDDGFAVLLDGRAVKTPAKTQLIVPTRALAEAISQEWDSQVEKIDPQSMPYTRMANSALDKVLTQRKDVIDMLSEYGASDLLCYRAHGPESLIARQAAAWDPLIDWADETFGVRLVATAGVMFVAQPDDAAVKLKAPIEAMSAFEIAAFHDLVTISGSLLIGLAATRLQQPIEDLWAASRVDETWQAEQWGEDEEATAMAAVKHEDFLHAFRFWQALQ